MKYLLVVSSFLIAFFDLSTAILMGNLIYSFLTNNIIDSQIVIFDLIQLDVNLAIFLIILRVPLVLILNYILIFSVTSLEIDLRKKILLKNYKHNITIPQNNSNNNLVFILINLSKKYFELFIMPIIRVSIESFVLITLVLFIIANTFIFFWFFLFLAIIALALVLLLGGIVQKNISNFLNYENKISNLIENLYVESISHYLIKDKGWYKNILEFFKKSRKKYVVAATVNSMGKYVSDLVVVIILLLFYVNNFNLIYEIEQNIFSLLIALSIKILTSISTLLGSLIALREGISVKKKIYEYFNKN